MKILITGGVGYLGSVITRNLLRKHEVIVYDNLMYNQTSLVDLCHNKNFIYHYGDVREWSKLKYIVEQVDVIITTFAKIFYINFEQDYASKFMTLIELMIMHRKIFSLIANLHDLVCKGTKDYKQALSNV